MLKKKIIPKTLFNCLALDLIGCASYLVPLGGELFDIAWAPLSALIYFAMFGKWKGTFITFFKEALPLSDFIPTFTLSWLLEEIEGQLKNAKDKSSTRKKIEPQKKAI